MVTCPTTSRHRLTLFDGSTVTVNRINGEPGAISDASGWRCAYGYTVRSADGTAILRGRDLHGPCGRYTDAAAPTAREMAGTLLSFLLAAVEHYNAHVFLLKRDMPSYVPHFSADADEWAFMVCDELAAVAFDLAEA
jgi:hypothetical protein